jgi:hypothetical protein
MVIPPNPLSKEDMERIANTAKLGKRNFDIAKRQMGNVPDQLTIKEERLRLKKVVSDFTFLDLGINSIMGIGLLEKVNKQELGVKELLGAHYKPSALENVTRPLDFISNLKSGLESRKSARINSQNEISLNKFINPPVKSYQPLAEIKTTSGYESFYSDLEYQLFKFNIASYLPDNLKNNTDLIGILNKSIVISFVSILSYFKSIRVDGNANPNFRDTKHLIFYKEGEMFSVNIELKYYAGYFQTGSFVKIKPTSPMHELSDEFEYINPDKYDEDSMLGKLDLDCKDLKITSEILDFFENKLEFKNTFKGTKVLRSKVSPMGIMFECSIKLPSIDEEIQHPETSENQGLAIKLDHEKGLFSIGDRTVRFNKIQSLNYQVLRYFFIQNDKMNLSEINFQLICSHLRSTLKYKEELDKKKMTNIVYSLNQKIRSNTKINHNFIVFVENKLKINPIITILKGS